jgi:hypothetical protein
MAAVAIRRAQSNVVKLPTNDNYDRLQSQVNSILYNIGENKRKIIENDANYTNLINYQDKLNYINNYLLMERHADIFKSLQDLIAKRQLRQETLDNILNSPEYANANVELKTEMLYRIYPSPIARMKARFTSGGKKRRTRTRRIKIRKSKKSKKNKKK